MPATFKESPTWSASKDGIGMGTASGGYVEFPSNAQTNFGFTNMTFLWRGCFTSLASQRRTFFRKMPLDDLGVYPVIWQMPNTLDIMQIFCNGGILTGQGTAAIPTALTIGTMETFAMRVPNAQNPVGVTWLMNGNSGRGSFTSISVTDSSSGASNSTTMKIGGWTGESNAAITNMACLWNRLLTDTELLSMRISPYQVVAPSAPLLSFPGGSSLLGRSFGTVL